MIISRENRKKLIRINNCFIMIKKGSEKIYKNIKMQKHYLGKMLIKLNVKGKPWLSRLNR